MLPCAFKMLLQVDCPACGAQRSFLFLLNGELEKSFYMYPPLMLVMLLSALWIVYLLKPGIVRLNLLRRYTWFVLAAVMINYTIHFFI